MSLEDDGFIKDVREELEKNMEEFFKYYNFIENHKIRNLIFFHKDEHVFFEGSVIGTLDQRYRDFYRGKFNRDMDEDVRMTMLDIIKENLPVIREKFNEFITARDKDYQGKSGW